MRRSLVIASLWIVALFLLACIGLGLPLDLVIAIGLGWIWYLARVLPQVAIDRGGVLTAILCLALFLAGSQAFLAWLHGQAKADAGPEDGSPRRWKVRWTISLGALIVLMFVAGLSAAGVVHQVGWLLTSGEPLGDSHRAIIARVVSISNLKQIGLALHNYHETHQTYPPGGTFDAVGRPLHGWQAMLLPFIEQKALHDRIDFSVSWDDPRNATAYRTEVSEYLYPFANKRRDNAGYALSHYAGNAHVLGGEVARSQAEVKDGASNTILAGEAAGAFQPWGYPANWRDPALGINRSPEGFGSPSPGGANFLFVDGSVHFLKNTIDPRVLRSLGTPAGGETVSSDTY